MLRQARSRHGLLLASALRGWRGWRRGRHRFSVDIGSHWQVRLGHSSACVMIVSYKNGVFFFQILYSSLIFWSSGSGNSAGHAMAGVRAKQEADSEGRGQICKRGL
eukprot:SAG31_NODE_30014_length_386_cov_1.205575_1_plen_105_part_10